MHLTVTISLVRLQFIIFLMTCFHINQKKLPKESTQD